MVSFHLDRRWSALTPLEELVNLASEGIRTVFVAEKPINLQSAEGTNCVYVLQLPLSAPGAAGGRVSGIGQRRIEKLYRFHLENGRWTKTYETENEERLNRFELPYHAAGLSVTMPDGTEKLVSGVVDEQFITGYNETARSA